MNMIHYPTISRGARAPLISSNEIWLALMQLQQPGLAPKRLISTAVISRRALAPVTDLSSFDLSVKNPDGGEEVIHRSPQDIMDEIAALDLESAEVLQTIRGLL
jgi:hypothetical protein